jgi:hypothetical protein
MKTRMKESYRLRLLVVGIICAAMSGCGGASAPAPVTSIDETKSTAYQETVSQLSAMNREAEAAYRSGKADDAARIMDQEKPLITRVLKPPKPSLEAMVAASDLSQLYGTMLLNNRHYGWARVMFQENLARWKSWRPVSEDTKRRLQLASDGIADCDKHLVE